MASWLFKLCFNPANKTRLEYWKSGVAIVEIIRSRCPWNKVEPISSRIILINKGIIVEQLRSWNGPLARCTSEKLPRSSATSDMKYGWLRVVIHFAVNGWQLPLIYCTVCPGRRFLLFKVMSRSNDESFNCPVTWFLSGPPEDPKDRIKVRAARWTKESGFFIPAPGFALYLLLSEHTSCAFYVNIWNLLFHAPRNL